MATVLASAWRSTKTDKRTPDRRTTCPSRGVAAPARPSPAAAWLWPPALFWGCWPWPSGVRPAPVGLTLAPASPSVVLIALVALNRGVAFVFLRHLAPVIAQQFLATRRALLPLRLDKGCNPLRMALTRRHWLRRGWCGLRFARRRCRGSAGGACPALVGIGVSSGLGSATLPEPPPNKLSKALAKPSSAFAAILVAPPATPPTARAAPCVTRGGSLPRNASRAYRARSRPA